jgi:hypothetical protein
MGKNEGRNTEEMRTGNLRERREKTTNQEVLGRTISRKLRRIYRMIT